MSRRIHQRHKKVTLFKLGKLWVFKHFFDDKETFKTLAENYNYDKFQIRVRDLRREEQGLKRRWLLECYL
ncbi:MAG: hypothetical protein IPI63_08705 [Methanothrix sp.]|jgi:hypothetical protein|uniref:hypothetical protein n=1 Tax=Methanothrix sp. TaxID=90426 RepID=UPI001BD2C3BD|nr:hypothetical protein [Methanothrix sp.]MBK7386786.1 hypothetical protein [Methanothrix sp.]